MLTSDGKIHLGIGLIELGREWGHIFSSVPEEKIALEFLQFAYELGITIFDTAASYGKSEERLGKFLRTLTPRERARLTITTKFGEHWNSENQEAYTDHSYDALCHSLDRSLHHLGQINLIQLHKANPAVLQSDDLSRAWNYARSLGIINMGASVSDVETSLIAINENVLSAVQLPYNVQNTKFEDVIEQISHKGKYVIINRPYHCGKLLYLHNNGLEEDKRVEAFRFIFRKKFSGVILTGTKSITHLKENWEAFNKASIN